MGDHEFDYLLVAAIDFGTTYSGYAFSLTGSKDHYGRRKIFMNTNWGGNVGCLMYKTPTCLLLDANGEFESFGFQADEQFSKYVEDRKENTCMFFKSFKMQLIKQHKDITEEMKLKATNGRQYPAIEVFAHSLRYLSGHLKERLDRTQVDTIPEDSICWVITVPAIWNDAAKQFMRKAAYKAGLASAETSDRLRIALEPEAASIYCADLGIDSETYSPNPVGLSVGTKYMIVDCGGGTVDITTHQMIEGGYVNEVYQPTGGPWGGDRVNERFIDLWNKIFGEDIVEEFKDSCRTEYNEMLRDFELKKRGRPSQIHISLKFNLHKMIKKKLGTDIEDVIANSGIEHIRFSNGLLVVELPLVERLFSPIIGKIINHLHGLLRNPKLKDITHMVLVGGFSESELLQRRLKEEFECENMRVVVSEEAGLSVVKGAVEFGFSPDLVRARVPALTYGVRTTVPFDEAKHPSGKRVLIEGRDMCKDYFYEFVEAGTPVELRQVMGHRFFAVSDNQTFATVYLYSTKQTTKGVKFTTDEGMSRCGEVKVDMPDTASGREREVEVNFTFGGTEIEVEARDVTSGKKSNISIDFHTR